MALRRPVQSNFDQGVLTLDDVIGSLIMYEPAIEWTMMEHEELGGSMWQEDGSWALQEYGVSQETLEEFLGNSGVDE